MAEPETNHTDEHFRALMEGLRTTLPGVQVLFAFLLTLPLQGRFADISGLERGTYFVALFAAALSSVLLIAPSVHQRMRAPHSGMPRKHDTHLSFTVRLTNVGTVLFLVALAASVYLVTDLVFDATWASIPTAIAVAIAAWAWFYVPLIRWATDD